MAFFASEASFSTVVARVSSFDLLRLAYPIHPELFDRLSKEWATLPNFQKTRGVLKFMANVVGVRWKSRPDRIATLLQFVITTPLCLRRTPNAITQHLRMRVRRTNQRRLDRFGNPLTPAG